MTLVRAFGALFAVAFLAAPAAAQHDGGAMKGSIAVEAAWARATPSMARAGAAYFTVRNTGAEDDRLIGASTPVAGSAELHTHIHEGGIMRMRRVPAIAVPAGQAVTLAPGGLHVMLMGLKAPLAEDTRFPLTLVFEKAGRTTVSVPVRAIGAMGPMPGGPMGGGAHKMDR